MEERRILTGNPVSKGITKAEAYHYEPLMLNVEVGYFKPGKETEYWKAFKTAHTAAKCALEKLHDAVALSDEKAASIFSAHIMLLEDEDLLYEIQHAILHDRMYPEIAIEACFGQHIAVLQHADDEVIAQRARDMYDVKRRLLRNYLGKLERCLSHLDKDVIVVAKDLLPSDVATIDRVHVKGIIVEEDVTNSHVAVLARGFGIPMIVGVVNATTEIADGMMLAMDAVTGELVQTI